MREMNVTPDAELEAKVSNGIDIPALEKPCATFLPTLKCWNEPGYKAGLKDCQLKNINFGAISTIFLPPPPHPNPLQVKPFLEKRRGKAWF